MKRNESKETGNRREKNAKLNIVISLLCQLLTMICGLITPRYMLRAFGSDANGAVTSVTTFLGYIMLLEGGIGGVARAALYKPLADGDNQRISEVMAEIKRFFRRVGYVFVPYVIVIAFSFKSISHSASLEWSTSFLLVIIISISTFAQYFIGISNSVLINASQRQYINNAFNVVGIILNTVMVVVLTNRGYDLLSVKLASSVVYTVKPIALWLYVKRHFNIIPIKGQKKNILKDKWTGLGQHIAYFLHTHTDVVILTLFGNLAAVSVYGVYNMVTSAIQNISSSFSAGMEAVFGDMYAKNEKDTLNRTFDLYDTLVSVVSVVLFGTTMVLIIPFVKIYTAEITDANYIEPVFSILLVCACLLHCLRSPYHNLVIAAGHFKQTQTAAYGEALINIVSSILLVIGFGLSGVALGTVLATLFRFVYYALYISKKILNRKVMLWFKREAINSISIVLIYLSGGIVLQYLNYSDYLSWAIAGIIMFVVSGIITLTLNLLFYRQICFSLAKRIIKR